MHLVKRCSFDITNRRFNLIICIVECIDVQASAWQPLEQSYNVMLKI